VSSSSEPSCRKVKGRVPEGIRVYAVGDIHGRLDLLERVLAGIDADMDQHPVSNAIRIFLGDYIDRGQDSKRVLDRIITCCATYPTVCLIGNHEVFMREFLRDPNTLAVWRRCGGLSTLSSYGFFPTIIEADDADQREVMSNFDRVLPHSHRKFLANLRPYFILGDFFFVHAGIRPGIRLTMQAENDLLWIRDDFLSCEDDHGKVVVHGHTPVLEPDIQFNRINIDTGAYATGKLTCMALERNEIRFI
jgi:serine/threonine protein phosphatase 1